jgi:enoyl-CoA hydratase/carnithine racemase
MACSTLNYEIKDRILTPNLNWPQVLNTFSVTMGEELVLAFNAAIARPIASCCRCQPEKIAHKTFRVT